MSCRFYERIQKIREDSFKNTVCEFGFDIYTLLHINNMYKVITNKDLVLNLETPQLLCDDLYLARNEEYVAH